MSDRYPCPVAKCDGDRKADQVMCGRCWYLVPQGLRNTIWRLYRDHQGSEAHRAACAQAIQYAGEQLAKRRSAQPPNQP